MLNLFNRSIFSSSASSVCNDSFVYEHEKEIEENQGSSLTENQIVQVLKECPYPTKLNSSIWTSDIMHSFFAHYFEKVLSKVRAILSYLLKFRLFLGARAEIHLEIKCNQAETGRRCAIVLKRIPKKRNIFNKFIGSLD